MQLPKLKHPWNNSNPPCEIRTTLGYNVNMTQDGSLVRQLPEGQELVCSVLDAASWLDNYGRGNCQEFIRRAELYARKLQAFNNRKRRTR